MRPALRGRLRHAADRRHVGLAVRRLARCVLPEGLPQRAWLQHYAEEFPTVEVNNAFYRLPERSVFERWREETPDGFVVAVKVSRYLTHIRRFRDPAEPVARLVARADGLGDRLGPYLLQLPPTLGASPEALDACLGLLPPRRPGSGRAPTRVVVDRRGARRA